MIEKVNPKHPDKIADRIAGAIVDLAYTKQDNPKVAVEVLIGHNKCFIINETSVHLTKKDIVNIVNRIAGVTNVTYMEVPQDAYLAKNQRGRLRCGDNGIFKGVPLTEEQKKLSHIAQKIYSKYNSDGKYILDGDKLIICQSNATNEELRQDYPNAIINPLGYWVGGIDVDGRPYEEIVEIARKFIYDLGALKNLQSGGSTNLNGSSYYIHRVIKFLHTYRRRG